MIQRRLFVCAAVGTVSGAAGGLHGLAWAHHGWSSFDPDRPLYLEGRAQGVKWRNPHVEFMLELSSPLRLPADLAQRSLPAQSVQVDGRALLAKASLPNRRDPRWEIELAPLSRLEQWKVPPMSNGASVAVLGFGFAGEKGEPLLRAEYLFLDGKTYGLRSAPL